MKRVEIRKDWYWVGNLNPELRVFDVIMETEFGTSYNAYILKGSEKTVLFEATKLKFYDEFVEKVQSIVPIEQIDYLVVSHTEPDHTGVIEKLLDIHPGLKIVASPTGISFMKEICNRDFTEYSKGRKTKSASETRRCDSFTLPIFIGRILYSPMFQKTKPWLPAMPSERISPLTDHQ